MAFFCDAVSCIFPPTNRIKMNSFYCFISVACCGENRKGCGRNGYIPLPFLHLVESGRMQNRGQHSTRPPDHHTRPGRTPARGPTPPPPIPRPYYATMLRVLVIVGTGDVAWMGTSRSSELGPLVGVRRSHIPQIAGISCLKFGIAHVSSTLW